MLKFQLGTFQTFQTGKFSKLLNHTVCRPKQGRSELCHLTAERLTSTNSPSVCTNMLPRRRFFLPSPWPGETLSWIANSTKCVKPVPYLCFCAAPLARKKTWHAASHLLQGQESRSIWLKNAPAFLHRFRTSTDFCFRKGETLNRTGQPSSNTPALIFSKRRRKSYNQHFQKRPGLESPSNRQFVQKRVYDPAQESWRFVTFVMLLLLKKCTEVQCAQCLHTKAYFDTSHFFGLTLLQFCDFEIRPQMSSWTKARRWSGKNICDGTNTRVQPGKWRRAFASSQSADLVWSGQSVLLMVGALDIFDLTVFADCNFSVECFLFL